MPDTTITGLTNASALTGAERVPMDQSGTTVDAAASAIAALATKSTVGLSNVDNTSDADKPISTATQEALNAKAAAGAIGSSGLTMTAGVLGRESGTGAPVVLSLSGLSIVAGVLTVTATGSFDPASPGAIGGTTAAAGAFTALSSSTSLLLPNTAGSAAGHLYRSADTLRYRDGGNVERLLLNAADNLANLGSAATARSNLGLGTAATAASGDFLPTTFTPGTITYGATVDLDMSALAGGYRTISLTGALTFTTSNRASGRTATLRLICDASGRDLTFPAGWVFVGSKPSTLAASKTAVLSLTFFGTADTDCVAAYGVQP